jgi:hypothetical protein
VVVTTPLDETSRCEEPEEALYVTEPVLPVVESVVVKAPDEATVVVALVGVVVSAAELTMRSKVHVPLSPKVSTDVPDAAYTPTARVPLVVTTPLDEITTLGAPADCT